MLAPPANKVLKPLQIWKKSVLDRYNIISVHLLEWPTLTLEILDGNKAYEEDMTSVRLLYGTDTNDGEKCVEQDFVYLTDIPIPSDKKKVDINTYCEETGEAGGTGMLARHICRPSTYHKIIHDTEVNVARSYPTNQDIIATRGNDKYVNIFNRTKQPGLGGIVTAIDSFKPDSRFDTEGEGWGLCFGHNTLFSGDSMGCLASWDIIVTPTKASKYNISTPINDLKSSPIISNLIIASCEDGNSRIFDTRNLQIEALKCGYSCPLNASCFSYFDSRIVSMVSNNGNFLTYDLRKTSSPLFAINAHGGPATFVASSPFDASVFATGGDDGLIKLWKINGAKTGMGVENIFTHDGHTAPITGLTFSPNIPLLISSASEDHTIMTWQPNL